MNTLKFQTTRASSTPILSIPILACVYAVIVSPLLLFFTYAVSSVPGVMETRNENKFFWPAMFAIAVIFGMRNFFNLGRVIWPTHILCLLAYLAFAGASVLWAFAPELSFVRYVQQVMVVATVILPPLLAVRQPDLMRGLFLCLALAAVLNVFFIIGGYQTIVNNLATGYSGYFLGKNYLGECAAIALMASLHELFYTGFRRVAGIAVAVVCIMLLLFANSKTALGLAFLIPIVSGVMLVVRRTFHVSPAVIIWFIILGYLVFSKLTGFNMNRLSYIVYGDSTFTGRQIIWDFAAIKIAQSPLFGWGYQSFWLVGSDGPSIVSAPSWGWVRFMPNAHNGYYDTILEMGYIGLVLLATFVTTTLHGIGRVIDRNPARGWVILSLALYVIVHNGLESTWMRGFEFLWIVFLIIAAEIVRYCRPLHPTGRSLQRVAPHGSRQIRLSPRLSASAPDGADRDSTSIWPLRDNPPAR